MLDKYIEDRVEIKDDMIYAGLIQTNEAVYCICKGKNDNCYSKKFLFHNFFKEGIFVPRLKLIFAVNKYDYLAAYKMNGKYLGKIDLNIKIK